VCCALSAPRQTQARPPTISCGRLFKTERDTAPHQASSKATPSNLFRLERGQSGVWFARVSIPPLANSRRRLQKQRPTGVNSGGRTHKRGEERRASRPRLQAFAAPSNLFFGVNSGTHGDVATERLVTAASAGQAEMWRPLSPLSFCSHWMSAQHRRAAILATGTPLPSAALPQRSHIAKTN